MDIVLSVSNVTKEVFLNNLVNIFDEWRFPRHCDEFNENAVCGSNLTGLVLCLVYRKCLTDVIYERISQRKPPFILAYFGIFMRKIAKRLRAKILLQRQLGIFIIKSPN